MLQGSPGVGGGRGGAGDVGTRFSVTFTSAPYSIRFIERDRDPVTGASRVH